MSRGVLFWVLMLLWLIFGLIVWWPVAGAAGGVWLYAPAGNHILVWVLFALLGWQVFGPAIK